MGSPHVLASDAVLVPGAAGVEAHRPGWLELRDGVVTGAFAGLPPPGAEVLGGQVIAPGLVDLQVNGTGDVEFATGDPEDWDRALRGLLARGVTTCCPTLCTAPLDAYDGMLAVAQAALPAPDGWAPDRARIAGVHLEGPFLGDAPGAHPRGLLRPADPEWLAALLDARPDTVRIVTLAPEADAGLAATRLLAARGVIVALGHSGASDADARRAADAGATLVTHLFNGMAALDHRAPGLVVAALDDPRLTPTLIGDLVHVHASVMRVACAVKARVALVSDAVAVETGTSAGLRIEERDGAARLADGSLAGSVIAMDDALRNAMAIGLGLERAVELAAVVPARVLGLDTFGSRGIGGIADLVSLDAATDVIRGVWLAGHRAYPG